MPIPVRSTQPPAPAPTRVAARPTPETYVGTPTAAGSGKTTEIYVEVPTVYVDEPPRGHWW